MTFLPHARAAGLAAACACAALSAPAAAADPDVPLRAEARLLFEEARRLTTANTYTADACAKFAESLRLDPGMGTKFYLSDCYEHIGRYASAWVLFSEVADEAKRAGMGPREQQARSRADAVKPKLTRMIVAVPDDVKSLGGLEIRRDEVVLGPGQWGASLPVDAGRHTISVGAPGKRSWQTSVDASGEGATVTVTIPTLKDDGPAAPGPTVTATPGAASGSIPMGAATAVPAGSVAPDVGPWPMQRKVALGAGGVGVAALAVGIGLGFDAAGKVSAARSECNDANPAVCTQKGSDLLDGAKTSGTMSTIAFIAGGVLLAGGVVLFLVTPAASKEAGARKGPQRSAWIAPAVGNGVGAVVGGAW